MRELDGRRGEKKCEKKGNGEGEGREGEGKEEEGREREEQGGQECGKKRGKVAKGREGMAGERGARDRGREETPDTPGKGRERRREGEKREEGVSNYWTTLL